VLLLHPRAGTNAMVDRELPSIAESLTILSG